MWPLWLWVAWIVLLIWSNFTQQHQQRQQADQALSTLTCPSARRVSSASVSFSSARVAIEQVLGVVQADQLCPAPQGAVARDLVMLDGLRGGDQAGIESGPPANPP